MKLFEWFKRLFKRKKATHVVASTAQSRYKNFSIEPTTTEERQRYVRIKPTPTTPITHPSRYRKFFKKRQPTTARKLWKPNAKIEEEYEENEAS
jgi:uracil-DNA glycosylase